MYKAHDRMTGGDVNSPPIVQREGRQPECWAVPWLGTLEAARSQRTGAEFHN